MIKAVLFDLDGTLLPMDLDEFIKYINETNEQAFSEMLAGRRNKLKIEERAQI